MSKNEKLTEIMQYLDVCINLAGEREIDPENTDTSLYYSIIRSTLVEFKADAQKIIDGKFRQPTTLN